MHGDLVTHAGRGPPVEVRYSADASSLGALALDLLDHRTSTTPFGTRTTLVVPQKPALSPPAGATLFFLTFALPRSDGSHAVTGTVAMRPTAAAVPGADLSDLLCTGRVAAGDFLSGGAHVLGGTLVAASTVDAAGSGTGVPGPGGVAVAGRGDAVGVCGGIGRPRAGGHAGRCIDGGRCRVRVRGPGSRWCRCRWPWGCGRGLWGQRRPRAGGHAGRCIDGGRCRVRVRGPGSRWCRCRWPWGCGRGLWGQRRPRAGGHAGRCIDGGRCRVRAGGPGPGGVTVNGYSLQAAGFVPTLLR